MIDNLQPYPEYKKSGLPWLGRAPSHWTLPRMKSAVYLNPRKGESAGQYRVDAAATFLPMERVGTDGRIDASITRPVSQLWNGFTYFRKGDVLVAKITPCFENGKGACLDNLPTEIGFGSTEFHVLRPGKNVTSGFLFLLTRLHFFRDMGAQSMTGSAGQQRVPASFIANYPTILPPLDEQAAIVRFLDHGNGKIERAIRAKRKLIALLNEQKQAIIHRAVTRGLDPSVKLKPSGIPWLGDVPEHWEVMPLRRLVTAGRRITYGIVQPGYPDKSGRFMIRGKDYSFGWASPDSIFRVSPVIENPYTRSRLKSGDIVMTIVGAGVGNVAVVPEWLDGANITQTTARIAVNTAKANPAFVELVLQGPVGRRNLERYVYGSAQPRMNLPHVGAFEIPVPPYAEQFAIIKSLGRNRFAAYRQSIEQYIVASMAG
jgi:type I restriction enzyme S subunit